MQHLKKITVATLILLSCSPALNAMNSAYESFSEKLSSWMNSKITDQELTLSAQAVAPLFTAGQYHSFFSIAPILEKPFRDKLPKILLDACHKQIDIHHQERGTSIWGYILWESIVKDGSAYKTARNFFAGRIHINDQYNSGKTALIRVLEGCIPQEYPKNVIHFESPLNEILTDFYPTISREHEQKLLEFCSVKDNDTVPQEVMRSRIAKVIAPYFPRKINLNRERLDKLHNAYFTFVSQSQKNKL